MLFQHRDMPGSSPLSSLPVPFRAWWARRSPAAGTAVTAAGTVSAALRLAGRETLSRILLLLA
ncbi:hypothetical protein SUDANB15_04530 [Streptomyces sp. enrichment culture]